MPISNKILLTAAFLSLPLSFASANDMPATTATEIDNCAVSGPQTPRDIDSKKGTNKRVFSLAPNYKEMNLCNIHFHKNSEHKAKAFSIPAEDGTAGFQCGISKNLSAAEMAAPSADICHGLKPGDTIEVHWVHSSCDVKPGESLAACLSPSCANPNLRVETQVFTLVNDAKALNFNDLSYDGNQVNGYHQAQAIPTNTGKAIEFIGSTTGPKFNDKVCSPLQVSWSVRPKCAKLNINSLGAWCKNNTFNENHGHGVRKLVIDPANLSKIK